MLYSVNRLILRENRARISKTYKTEATIGYVRIEAQSYVFYATYILLCFLINLMFELCLFVLLNRYIQSI